MEVSREKEALLYLLKAEQEKSESLERRLTELERQLSAIANGLREFRGPTPAIAPILSLKEKKALREEQQEQKRAN